MRRVLSLLMVAFLVAGAAAACSSDGYGGDDGGTDTTDATSGDSGSGGSDEVEAYCAATQDLGDQLAALVHDVTSGDSDELMGQWSELRGRGQELVTANIDDEDTIARIDECTNALTDRATGG